MDLLNIEKTEDKVFQNKYRKVVYSVYRKDETPIKTILFRDIANTFINKYGVNNVMIRAENNTGIFTYKAFDSEFQVDDMDDYWEGRVKSTKEFEYWYNIQITIRKNNSLS